MITFFNRSAILLATLAALTLPTSYRDHIGSNTHTLTVEVQGLRNNKGVVVFALYNKDGSLPDEHYKKYYKKAVKAIEANGAAVVFPDLPAGTYAVNILHDENSDHKIDRGLFLPREGIGFSNITSVGPGNKPSFRKASFILDRDRKVVVKIIYL